MPSLMAHRGPHKASQRPRGEPEEPQDGPERAHEASKIAPRLPHEGPKRLPTRSQREKPAKALMVHNCRRRRRRRRPRRRRRRHRRRRRRHRNAATLSATHTAQSMSRSTCPLCAASSTAPKAGVLILKRRKYNCRLLLAPLRHRLRAGQPRPKRRPFSWAMGAPWVAP